jgi:D-alanine-D-alanine ligase
MALSPVPELTDDRSVWTWQTKTGLEDGILLIGHLDVPLEMDAPAVMFRVDAEWLYGEGIASSRAPLVCMQFALRALRSQRRLRQVPLGLLYYTDEGRDCRYSQGIIRQAVERAGKVLVLRPGNLENNVILRRRGRRKYRFTVSGESRKLGKLYRKRGALRWTTACLDEFARLTSKEDRIAVAASEVKTQAYPDLLPHRVTATILASYMEAKKADAAEQKMRETIKTRDYHCSLELISDRPPMTKTTASERLYEDLVKVARDWEIPLERESSLSPSAAGLVPRSKPVVCGIGPVARMVDTPFEAVQRISLMQRTLLLAQYLVRQAGNKKT